MLVHDALYKLGFVNHHKHSHLPNQFEQLANNTFPLNGLCKPHSYSCQAAHKSAQNTFKCLWAHLSYPNTSWKITQKAFNRAYSCCTTAAAQTESEHRRLSNAFLAYSCQTELNPKTGLFCWLFTNQAMSRTAVQKPANYPSLFWGYNSFQANPRPISNRLHACLPTCTFYQFFSISKQILKIYCKVYLQSKILSSFFPLLWQK